MKRILVGFDESKSAATALRVGLEYAAKSTGSLRALYVEDERALSYMPFSVSLAAAIGVSPRTPQPLPADKMVNALAQAQELRDGIRQSFKELVEPYLSDQLSFSQLPELVVGSGLPWEQLALAAESADVVFMGRVGEDSGLRDFAAHETVETVAKELIAPLLLITEHFTTPTRLLLAYDGSEPAQRVMRSIPALCEGLSVEAISVLYIDEEVQPDASSVESAMQYLSQVKPPVEAVLRKGQVVEQILSVAAERGVNLIAAGAFGAKGMRHFLWGSATEALLDQQEYSLLLTR